MNKTTTYYMLQEKVHDFKNQCNYWKTMSFHEDAKDAIGTKDWHKYSDKPPAGQLRVVEVHSKVLTVAEENKILKKD